MRLPAPPPRPRSSRPRAEPRLALVEPSATEPRPVEVPSAAPVSLGGDDAGAPVLIAGAGAAGLACALAAARGGVSVLLCERAPALGGTVAGAQIHTLGGLCNEAGEPVLAGPPGALVAELVERLKAADPRTTSRRIGRTRVLGVDPAVYRAVVTAWVAEEPRIRCLTGSEVVALERADGGIVGATLDTGGQLHRLRPRALVDATGEAAVVRRLDPDLVEPGEALAGLVAVLRGVEPGTLAFPKGVALIRRLRDAVAAATLPPECATLWPDSGVGADEVYLKLNLPAADFDPARMDAVLARLLDWLRPLPGFAAARLGTRGALGVRDGGRIRGVYRLTEADLTAGRRFPDAACCGCWPLEHRHPREGVQLQYLPPGTRYDIPLRALAVRGVAGLYAAGRCLSAEPRAQASARVVGTCWGMGAGLGRHLAERAGGARATTPARQARLTPTAPGGA